MTPGAFIARSTAAASLLILMGCPGKGTEPEDKEPASVVITPAGAQTLASGSTLQLSASVKTRNGKALPNVAVTWTASSGATVSSTGLVTGVVAGPATITAATATGVSGTSSVTVTPGAATRLWMRTQPGGTAASGAALGTQPVIEIRDATGNVVTSATNTVTASIATGGGTLGGTATVTAAAGVATFTNLSVTGTTGDRTLLFSATGLTSVTSAAFTVTGGAGTPPLIVATPSSFTFSASTGGNNPAAQTASITNGGTQPLGTLGGNIQFTSAATGWLAGSLSAATAPATLTLNASVGTLAPGSYTANVLITSAGASNTPLTIPVTFNVTASFSLAFGTGNRVIILDANGTATPPVVVRDLAGAVVTSPPVSFASRAPAIAVVSAAGTITAVSAGQAWIVATGNVEGSPRDSVLAVVTRDATGPILRADVPNVVFGVNDLITVPIVLDMRSSGKLSAATVTVTWPADFFTGFLTYVSHTLGAGNLSPIVSVNAATGIARISVANAAGVDGPVELMRLTFRATNSGRSGLLVLTANEVVTGDLTAVADKTTQISYPLRVR